MTWLRSRLQRDWLCQADKGLDAEQVGQHHRFLRQKLLKGRKVSMMYVAATMPFLSPTSLPGGSWARLNCCTSAFRKSLHIRFTKSQSRMT
jgi:hypothetical protein